VDNELFEDLLDSIREMKAILRGDALPSRVFRFEDDGTRWMLTGAQLAYLIEHRVQIETGDTATLKATEECRTIFGDTPLMEAFDHFKQTQWSEPDRPSPYSLTSTDEDHHTAR
jgi:hypothetical protein